VARELEFSDTVSVYFNTLSNTEEFIQTKFKGKVTYNMLRDNKVTYAAYCKDAALHGLGSQVTTTKLLNVIDLLLKCYDLNTGILSMINKAIRATSNNPKYDKHMDPMWVYCTIPLDWQTNVAYSMEDIRDFLVTMLKMDLAHRGADLHKVYRHMIRVTEDRTGIECYNFEPCTNPIYLPAITEFPHLNIISLYEKYIKMTENIAPTINIRLASGAAANVNPLFLSNGKKVNRMTPLRDVPARKLNGILTEVLKKAGYKETAHLLRGAVGTEMVANGCPWVDMCQHLDVSKGQFLQSYYRPEFNIDRFSLPPVPIRSHPVV
jgi:hypothetical protein